MSYKQTQVRIVRRKGSKLIGKGRRRTIYDMLRSEIKTIVIENVLKMSYRTVYAIIVREKRKKPEALRGRKRELCARSLYRLH